MLKILQNKGLAGGIVSILLLTGIFLFLWQNNVTTSEQALPENSGILFIALMKRLDGLHLGIYLPFLLLIIYMLIGSLLTLIINNYNILYKKTWLPFFFYVGVHFVFSHAFVFTPSIFLELCLLVVVNRYTSLDKDGGKVTGYLDIGLLTGTGFLFDLNMVLFVPAILIGLVLTGFFSVRRFFLFLTGFALPVYFLFVIYYAMGSQEYFNAHLWKPFQPDLEFKVLDKVRNGKWVTLGLLCFVQLISLVEMRANYTKNTIVTRRAHQFIFFITIFCFLALFCGLSTFEQTFVYFGLTIAILASYFFIKNKKIIIREVFFWVIILSLMMSNYY